jgi:hypothetical protein
MEEDRLLCFPLTRVCAVSLTRAAMKAWSEGACDEAAPLAYQDEAMSVRRRFSYVGGQVVASVGGYGMICILYVILTKYTL